MSAYTALVSAHLKILFRSREFLFWDLMFPVLLMILLGSAFGHSGFSATVGLSGHGPVRPLILHTLHHIAGVKVVLTQAGPQGIRSGHLDIWLQIQPHRVRLISTASPTSQMASAMIQGVIDHVNLGMLHRPVAISLAISHLAGPTFNYVDFLVPGILAMSLMTSGLFAGGALVTYRTQGILRRLQATPLSAPQFLLSRYTAQLVLALLETAILLGVAHVLYGFSPSGSVLAFVIFLLLGSTGFLMIGFFVANVVGTPEVASTINNVINLPMMFLSGVFYPVGQLPAFIKPLSAVLPLKYLAEALRNIMLTSQTLAQQTRPLLVLAGTAVVFGVLASWLFKWDARRV